MRSIFWSLEPSRNGSAENGKQIPPAFLTLSFLSVELLSLKRMWLTLPQPRDQTLHNAVLFQQGIPGAMVWRGELGSAAGPELHTLRSLEMFRNEITALADMVLWAILWGYSFAGWVS